MDIIALLASITTAAFVVLALTLVRRRFSAEGRGADYRVLDMIRRQRAVHTTVSDIAPPLRRSYSSLPIISRFLSRKERGKRTSLALERAGVALRPGEFLLLQFVFGFLGFVVVATFAGGGAVGLIIGIPVAIVAYLIPRFWLAWRTARRMKRFETQMINMLGLIAASVRSGFSLLQALDAAATRLGPPMADELERALNDVRYGRNMEDSLAEWSERLQHRDLQLVVTAISVQRHSGGNLAEVLENLASTMRDRVEVRQQIKSLTAYARLTSRVVALYPIAIAGILTAMRPDTWSVLWTEPVGYVMLGVALVLNTLAFTVMRGLAQIEY